MEMNNDLDLSPLQALSQEQLSQLLSLIGANTNPQPVPSTLRPSPKDINRQPAKWPEWDGSKANYRAYRVQLAKKIDNDWESLGGHESVCNSMMNTIPAARRNQLVAWFSSGGPNRDWNYELFLKHFDENFEDKTSARTAGEKLTRMRQATHQTFRAYLTEFEFMLAQAIGLHWDDRVKINMLSNGLSDRLTEYLITVDTPDNDYTLYVSQVASIAGKMESRENFLPKKGPVHTETWYITRSGFIPPVNSVIQGNFPNVPSATASQVIDSEGDTYMTGVGSIDITNLAAAVNALNSQSSSKRTSPKPPAPWRTPEEFSQLRGSGKCTRCGKKGHYYKNCPSFTWPRRQPKMNATQTNSLEHELLEEDMQNNISGKE